MPRSLLLVLSLAAGPCVVAQEGAQPLADEARLQRLGAIVAELPVAGGAAEALATEAARLCGFVVWSEAREVVAEPLSTPRLHLAVTPAELRGAVAMMQAGHRVARDDLLAGVDVLHRSLDLPGSATPAARKWLRDGVNSANPAARALSLFLDDLGRRRGQQLGGDADCELDPLQALLIVRVLSEDLATPLRQAIRRGEFGAEPPAERGRAPKGPALGDEPRFADAPGWAEDAYVGGVTGLFGEVVEGLGKAGKRYGDAVDKVNAIATIGKFLLTYTFLKGEVWDDDPDNPLIRTKDTDAGARCRLYASFTIDGTRVTDWLKDNRQMLALAGLDMDMPKTGPLKGIETEWDIREDRFSTKTHLIQLTPRHPDISKIRADDNGIASIEVDGAPQPRKLDPLNVMPVAKSVRIVVTPQVKATEMQQDLVDAVTGAIGIRGGTVGLLTPIIECLYRMKWKGGVIYDLQVRDWVEGETIGQGELSIFGSGSWFRSEYSYRHTIDRKLTFTDVTIDPSGALEPEPIDPKVFDGMPKRYRAQVEESMRLMREAAKKRHYFGVAPSVATVSIRDVAAGRDAENECGGEVADWQRTVTGGGQLAFRRPDGSGDLVSFIVHCDLEAKVATVVFDGSIDARVVATRTRRGNKDREERTQPTSVWDGVRLLPPYDDGELKMPLQEVPGVDPGITNYYGVLRAPVAFGDDFRGCAIFSWSVQRKKKQPAPKSKSKAK